MICPLCKKIEGRRLKIERGIEIFECKGCELGFVNQARKVKTFKRSYKSCNFLYDFEGYKKEEAKLRRRFDRLIQKIVEIKKKGKVLDVGAGFGLFSSILLKKAEFEIDAVEPVSMYRYNDTSKKKPRYFSMSFEEFIKNGKYDIVLLMDVLEHFISPFRNLLKAKSLLKKDGILVIQTPNYKSLMARMCKDWAWWMIEDHKYFFSPRSIKLALKKSGYKIIHFQSYENFWDFKRNLDGNFVQIQNPLLRKIAKGIFFTLFVPVYFLIRGILWEMGYGGLMFVIAEVK